MNTTPNTHTLLTALAALKGKLPHEVFPWAYKKFAPRSLTPGYGCAVDLYAPDVTLDDLLGVADACFLWPPHIEWIEPLKMFEVRGVLCLDTPLWAISGGPTRHAAVRNALERAAGVGE